MIETIQGNTIEMANRHQIGGGLLRCNSQAIKTTSRLETEKEYHD